MNRVVLVNSCGILLTLLLVLKEAGASLPLCQIGSKVSCDLVLESPYSKIFGLPNSILGFVIYLYLTLLFLFSKEISKVKILTYFVISSISVLASVALFYISYFVIGAICPYCFLSYIINFVNFFISLSLIRKVSFSDVGNFAVVIKPAFPAILAGVLIYFIGFSGKSVNLEKALVKESEVPVSPIPIAFSEPLVEFVDPLCPACIVWKNKRAQLEGITRTIYFPLDNQCNPALEKDFHKGACFLSKIFMCAKKLNSLKQVEESLSSKIRIDDLEEFFKSQFQREYECAQKVDDELRAGIQLGLDLKIQGTPTIYYRGFLIDLSKISLEDLIREIQDNELKD